MEERPSTFHSSFYPLPSSVSEEGGGNAAASTIVLLRTKSGIWNLRLGVAGEESGGAAKV